MGTTLELQENNLSAYRFHTDTRHELSYYTVRCSVTTIMINEHTLVNMIFVFHVYSSDHTVSVFQRIMGGDIGNRRIE